MSKLLISINYILIDMRGKGGVEWFTRERPLLTILNTICGSNYCKWCPHPPGDSWAAPHITLILNEVK